VTVDDNITDPSMITTLDELGDAWSQLLEQAGLSQRRLADKSARGVGMVPLPRATVSEIVHGRRLPSREQLTTFLTLVGVKDEDKWQGWDEAWNRLREQQSRFGRQETIPFVPIGTFLESGPEEAALRQLRRSIPEAAAELTKLGPGSAAMILGKWPNEITADILTAMDVHAATAVLLARPSSWRIEPVLRKMPRERAVACLAAMGKPTTVNRTLGWTGSWWLPSRSRRRNDDIFYIYYRKRQGIVAVVVLASYALIGGLWGITAWQEYRERRRVAKTVL
jgi:hypothetical protein